MKKLIAILACITLTLVCLTGCTSRTPAEDPANTTVTENTISDADRHTMYQNALDAAANGRYAEAVQNFASLGDFYDSKLLAVYYAALELETAESYEDALLLLDGISLFKDSGERLAGYPAKILARDYRLADEAEQADQLESALKQFTALGAYSDSAARAENVQQKIYARDYQKADEAEQGNQLESALKQFTALGAYSDSAARAENVQQKIYARDYQKADEAEQGNQLESALKQFTALGAYSDSAARAENVQQKIYERDYQAALALENDGKTLEAYDAFVALGSYSDSAAHASALQNKATYEKGLSQIQNGKYKSALATFTSLGDYMDSEEKAYCLGINDFASFDTIAPGVATFKFHNSYGLVNLNENITVAPQWSSVQMLSGDRLSAYKNEKYALIDLNGEVLSGYQWSDISKFSNDGLCVVAKLDTARSTRWDKYWLLGLMDTNGKLVGDVTWEQLGASNSGSYSPYVYAPTFYDDLIPVCKDGKWGFINQKGEVVVSPRYAKVKDFSDGLAAVKTSSGLWGFIDTTGKMVISTKYSDVSSFSNGRADVCLNGAWQIIDKHGKLVYFK